MQYRRLGKTGLEVSSLGFGLMRLPQQDGKIDKKQTEAMLNLALEKGVNYFDTAYPYMDGQSEVVFGELVSPAQRKNLHLVSKLPIWLVQNPSDPDKYLDEQLERLRTEYLDVYLIHAIFSSRWNKVLDLKIIEWLEKARKDGRIRHIGFSFHDAFPLFQTVLDHYDGWEVVQIQYNFLNENIQAGTRGLRYAAAREKGIVIMEPLYGGLLASPPGKIKKYWEEHQRDPVAMALNWLWDKPEISCVLSGMSNREQLEQNIALASAAHPGNMQPADKALLDEARQLYKELAPIPCTKCGYCQPCPSGVDIPRNFEMYNEAIGQQALQLNRSLYSWHFSEEAKASSCTQCGECLEKCPQQIPIPEWMPKVDKTLTIPEG